MENIKDGKLAGILKTFSITEFKEFGKFINSPYLNRTNRDVAGLYREIKKYFPDLNVNADTLYKGIYSGRQYNEKTLKNLFTDMKKLALDFLAYNNFRTKNGLISNLKAEAMLQKNLSKEYVLESENTLLLIKNDKIGSEDFFVNMRKYYQNKMTFTKTFYKDKSENVFINNSIECLAVLFLKDISNILVNKQLSVYLNKSTNESVMLNYFIEHFDLESFMEKFSYTKNEYYPYIAFRYFLYKDLCSENDLQWFYRMKDIVYANIDKFSRETQFEATWSIINSCAMTNRRSVPALRKESFDMLLFQLKKGLHIAPGSSYYSTPAFNQLLAEALYFKEFNLIEDIIYKHSMELEPGIRDEMHNWGLASLFFEKREYEKALSYAYKINFKEPNFKIQSKFLLFRIFFELNLYEQAYSVINTFLHTLKLEDLSSEVKARYELTFKNSLKFLKIYSKKNDDEIELFRRKINLQNFIGKKWMLEKLNLVKSYL